MKKSWSVFIGVPMGGAISAGSNCASVITGHSVKRGSWEIEHSRPRSRGGTDHLNNLYVACISCNRSKGNGTTASARAANGYRKAPLSKEKKTSNAWTGGAVGVLAFLFVPPPLRLAAAVVGGVVGAIVGNSYEPD